MKHTNPSYWKVRARRFNNECTSVRLVNQSRINLVIFMIMGINPFK
jgi:hypothetical protein